MRKKTAVINYKPKANTNTLPDLVAKVKEDRPDEKPRFLIVGRAWTKDDGSIYVRLYGKQVVDAPFYLYPIEAE